MLRAGYAHVDITPPPEVPLQGYEFRFSQLPEGSEGVLEPLACKALALESEPGKASLIISLDLCILSVSLARSLREKVAQAVGCEPKHVLLACTHTHSGPVVADVELDRAVRDVLPEAAAAGAPAEAYTRWLAGRVVEAAARAAALTVPVDVSWQQGALGIGYTRRVLTDRGLRHVWNPQEQHELPLPPAADPACTVIQLRQTNGRRRWLLWSIGVHPVVLGKTSRAVSPDFPGSACRMIEQRNPDTSAMFLLGAAGSTHPQIATQDRPEGVRRVAEACASFVALLADAARATEATLKVNETAARFGRDELDLAAWALGEVWIASSPTELFGELSARLRERLGGPGIVATCVGGWTGYWPDEAAFDHGVYEVDSAAARDRGPADSAGLIDRLATLVEQIRPGRSRPVDSEATG
jgi:hypothetical protein